MAAARKSAPRSRAWRTRGRSPRRWRWSPRRRCARRRSGCARASVRREDPQHRVAPLAREPGVPASVPGRRATRVKTRRLHRRHDRQGPVRRPQHQRAARASRPSCRSWKAQGVKVEVVRDRQQGPRLPATASARKVVSHVTQLGDRPHAGEADRRGQGDARRLRGRPLDRGLSLLHPLHQHDEAGAGDRAAAAAVGRAMRAGPRSRRRTAGTTSTSPTRRPCSTRC